MSKKVLVQCGSVRTDSIHSYIPISVNRQLVGMIYRATNRCPWEYDLDLSTAYPEFENLIKSSNTGEALDLVRHTIYRKEGANMATMQENHQLAFSKMRDDARTLSEEVVTEAKHGHTTRAADASKRLRTLALVTLALSTEIQEIYSKTVDYAGVVGQVDVAALKRD